MPQTCAHRMKQSNSVTAHVDLCNTVLNAYILNKCQHTTSMMSLHFSLVLALDLQLVN